jgi:hypothetical protein
MPVRYNSFRNDELPLRFSSFKNFLEVRSKFGDKPEEDQLLISYANSSSAR